MRYQHIDNTKILIKSLEDQIDFLKSEIKSKNDMIIMILDDHKNEVGQPKPFGNRSKNKTDNTNEIHECHFQTPQKSSKIKKYTPITISPQETVFKFCKTTLKKTKLKKYFMAPFYGNENCLRATERLRGGSLLFTTIFPEIPGTHLINLGKMKSWVNLGATHWF